MNAIKVCLRDARPGDELYPWYNGDADLLEVRSKVPRAWPFGIDIDGTIIFDIDADRVLANLDFLIPKRFWRVQRAEIKPRPSRKARLMFTEETLTHKSFNLPLEAVTNVSRSYVNITFGGGVARGDSQCVALSQSCLAFVVENCLEGFHFSLE